MLSSAKIGFQIRPPCGLGMENTVPLVLAGKALIRQIVAFPARILCVLGLFFDGSASAFQRFYIDSTLILHWFYIDSTSSKRFTPLACPQLPPRVQDGWHTILAGVNLDVLPSAMATKLFFSCLILSRVAKQTISGKRRGGIWKLMDTHIFVIHIF